MLDQPEQEQKQKEQLQFKKVHESVVNRLSASGSVFGERGQEGGRAIVPDGISSISQTGGIVSHHLECALVDQRGNLLPKTVAGILFRKPIDAPNNTGPIPFVQTITEDAGVFTHTPLTNFPRYINEADMENIRREGNTGMKKKENELNNILSLLPSPESADITKESVQCVYYAVIVSQPNGTFTIGSETSTQFTSVSSENKVGRLTLIKYKPATSPPDFKYYLIGNNYAATRPGDKCQERIKVGVVEDKKQQKEKEKIVKSQYALFGIKELTQIQRGLLDSSISVYEPEEVEEIKQGMQNLNSLEVAEYYRKNSAELLFVNVDLLITEPPFFKGDVCKTIRSLFQELDQQAVLDYFTDNPHLVYCISKKTRESALVSGPVREVVKSVLSEIQNPRSKIRDQFYYKQLMYLSKFYFVYSYAPDLLNQVPDIESLWNQNKSNLTGVDFQYYFKIAPHAFNPHYLDSEQFVLKQQRPEFNRLIKVCKVQNIASSLEIVRILRKELESTGTNEKSTLQRDLEQRLRSREFFSFVDKETLREVHTILKMDNAKKIQELILIQLEKNLEETPMLNEVVNVNELVAFVPDFIDVLNTKGEEYSEHRTLSSMLLFNLAHNAYTRQKLLEYIANNNHFLRCCIDTWTQSPDTRISQWLGALFYKLLDADECKTLVGILLQGERGALADGLLTRIDKSIQQHEIYEVDGDSYREKIQKYRRMDLTQAVVIDHALGVAIERNEEVCSLLDSEITRLSDTQVETEAIRISNEIGQQFYVVFNALGNLNMVRHEALIEEEHRKYIIVHTLYMWIQRNSQNPKLVTQVVKYLFSNDQFRHSIDYITRRVDITQGFVKEVVRSRAECVELMNSFVRITPHELRHQLTGLPIHGNMQELGNLSVEESDPVLKEQLKKERNVARRLAVLLKQPETNISPELLVKTGKEEVERCVSILFEKKELQEALKRMPLREPYFVTLREILFSGNGALIQAVLDALEKMVSDELTPQRAEQLVGYLMKGGLSMENQGDSIGDAFQLLAKKEGINITRNMSPERHKITRTLISTPILVLLLAQSKTLRRYKNLYSLYLYRQ